MKAAVYYGRGDIRIEKVPTPTIGDREILVAMKACGVCGSDLMDWYLKPRAPLTLGHEPAGTVAKRGRKVKSVSVGDRVFVHHHVPCMTCHYCLNGDYTLCRQFHETNLEPGGFAEFFKVPAPNLQTDTLRIPEGLSFEEATFVEPVGCCVRALKKCNLKQGDSIVIIGAGPTGLIHSALSKVYGASVTIVSDLIESRLNQARRFGADYVMDPRKEDLVEVVEANTDGRGADIAIVTAPSPEAYRAGMAASRKGGKLCVFAPTDPGSYLRVSPKDLFFRELQIIPSYSASHLETREALRLIESRRLRVRELITHTYRLEETAKAFATARESEESLKVMVLNK